MDWRRAIGLFCLRAMFLSVQFQPSRSQEVVSRTACFWTIILTAILIMAGIEPNPGPQVLDFSQGNSPGLDSLSMEISDVDRPVIQSQKRSREADYEGSLARRRCQDDLSVREDFRIAHDSLSDRIGELMRDHFVCFDQKLQKMELSIRENTTDISKLRSRVEDTETKLIAMDTQARELNLILFGAMGSEKVTNEFCLGFVENFIVK